MAKPGGNDDGARDSGATEHTALGQWARNIELKARLARPDAQSALARAVQTAQRLATVARREERQCDTYFHAAEGRLKLREIDNDRAELIFYRRANDSAAKASDYLLVRVDDPAGMKQALASAWGIRAVVDKRRAIYWVENVRIHLDEVAGLGNYLEFESVLDATHDEGASRQLVYELTRQFGIEAEDLLQGSYGELIASRTPS